MSDEELLEDDEFEADDEDLEDDVIVDDLDELVVVDDLDAIDDEDDDLLPVVEPRKAFTSEEDEDSDDDSLDLEDEHHPDDVEDPLDVMLKERTAAAGMAEEADLEEEPEVDDRGSSSTKIVPRRSNEFLCSSCFLVLPLHQLADKKRKLCTDCV